MNLYSATNGFMGDGIVHCVLLAENDEQALALARESFKREELLYSDGKPKPIKSVRPEYWEAVTVTLLAPCDKPFVTQPSDFSIEVWEESVSRWMTQSVSKT